MQPTAHPARALGLATTLVLILGACTAAGPSIPSGSSTPPPTRAPGSPAAPPEAGPGDASPDAWLVVGRRGEQGLKVILASTLEEAYELPVGAPGKLWGQVVAATRAGKTTLVKEITVQPELPARTRSVDGAWRLPTIGDDTLPVGVSADGSTVVLVEDGVPADASTSRFAVLARGEATRILELAGSFEYDALSPEGSVLYVVEHLSGPPEGHYQVRAVDIAAGLIRAAVIVDKRDLGEAMGGRPITQLRHDNGVVFTLYRGAQHPFIHALNTREAWAICLDLPASGSGDPGAALDWGLAQSADGRSIFAVNATLGLAAAIDLGELSIRQTATFDAARAAAVISLAKFGHQEGGPVGRRLVASADGSTLFAAGAGGIVRIETEHMTVTGRLLDGAAVGALALTPDGSTLYALVDADGQIIKLDAASGQVVGQVPGDGFDRLVAIVPW
jgi:hypothetical protein